MDTETFQRAVTTPLVADPADDGRNITVRLVPWDRPSRVADRATRSTYTETFARGGLRSPADDVPVLVEREHDGPLVGTLTGTEDRDDGLYGTIRMSRSSIGTDTLADVEARILRSVSVDFLDQPVPAGTESVTRTNAVLRRVAFVLEPALDAPIVSVRSQEPNPTQEEAPMPEETVTPEVDPEPVVEHRPEPAPDPTPPLINSQRSAPTVPTRHAPVPRFESFGHFTRAAALGEIRGEELETYQRAFADVVTTDTTGLIREQWVTEVIDLMRTYTPTLNAWRTRTLPNKGMSISQPVVTTSPTVGVQSAQKDDITSTDIVIGTEQWAISTYAGGNDVSIQLIQRSEPDFLNEMLRLYVRELAQAINLAAATALTAAAAVGVSGNTALEYVDAAGFDTLVVSASGTFLDAFRRPADIMGISVDLWIALANAKDDNGRPLYPDINPVNSSGTMSAAATSGNIRRIGWYVDPDLGGVGDGVAGVIGVSEAFVTARGPIGTLTADVPLKLGRDVAVYQEMAVGSADASGLVQIVDAA